MNELPGDAVTAQPPKYEAMALYIDGSFVGAEDRKCEAIVNPADGTLLGDLPHATYDDLNHAVDAAARAFASWKRSSPMERSKILRAAAESLRRNVLSIARNITLDMGKPVSEAVSEVMSSADHCDWHAEECRRIYGRVIPSRSPNVRQLVLREPVGVCAAFTPWNFPAIQAIRKIAAAIGAGCTIVLKGPENAPSAIIAIARAFHDAGLPPGVLNIVWGVPHEVSRHLIASPVVRKVSFTGSTPVGKQLAGLAGLHMKRATMELGGHAPAIVFADANIEKAAEQLCSYKFRNAGQVCLSPSRIYVQTKVFDKFLSEFVRWSNAIRVGPGLDKTSTMGPLAHSRRIPQMVQLLADAHARKGEVVLGGERVGEKGSFFEPTVVTNLPDDALLMTTEPFGPIAAICAFSETAEVMDRANSIPYGLSSYVFTRSSKNSLAAQQGLEVGIVNINHWGQALPETPLGGVKDSGMGSEGGCETFDGYVTTKFVSQMDE